MTIQNRTLISEMLVSKALRAMSGYPKWLYATEYKACDNNNATFYYYYTAKEAWECSYSLIGSDDYFTYWDASGTAYKFYEVNHYPACDLAGYVEPGTPNYVEVTATLATSGSTETRPYDSAKLIQYSGYPVFATVDIGGNQYCVGVGFASALTVAAAAAACGLTDKGVDITLIM